MKMHSEQESLLYKDRKPITGLKRWLRVFAFFVLGTALVLTVMFMAVKTRGEGHWGYLLYTATEKPFRAVIEQQLGELGPGTPLGHDGEMFYLIARDPFGRNGTPSLIAEADNPRYRYRRILFSLIAGLGGTLNAPQTLFMMVLLAASGYGLVIAATADIAQALDLDNRPILLAMASPGLIVGSGLLLADSLAIGLALFGLAAFYRKNETFATLLFSLAILTRETMLLFPLAAAVCLIIEGRYRRLILVAGVPIIVAGLWEAWLMMHIPTDPNPFRKNLSLPYVGIWQTAEIWLAGKPRGTILDAAQMTLAVLMFLAGVILAAAGRHPLLWPSLVLWTLLGSLLSIEVWAAPINALRAIAPLWIFIALAYYKGRGDNP